MCLKKVLYGDDKQNSILLITRSQPCPIYMVISGKGGQYWGVTQAKSEEWLWSLNSIVNSQLKVNVSCKRKQNWLPSKKFPLAGNKQHSQISCQHVTVWEYQVSSKDTRSGFGSQVGRITRKLCDMVTTSWKESGAHVLGMSRFVLLQRMKSKLTKAFSTLEMLCTLCDLIPTSNSQGNSLPLY